jgi:lipoprotein-anchoring transpeptidase ErfK/SrfK
MVSVVVLLLGAYVVKRNLDEAARRTAEAETFSKPIYLNFENSSRSLYLKDIGIVYDKNADKVLIDHQTLNTYLDSLEKDFAFLSKNTVISMEAYYFQVPSDKAAIKLDRTPFENAENITKLVNNPQPKIKVTLSTVDDLSLQTQKTNDLITKISAPLLIKYGRNPIYIPQDTIKSFMQPQITNGVLTEYLSYDQVSQYLDMLDQKYASPDVVVIHKEADDAIRRAILFRAADNEVNNAVILPLQGKPKSDGSLHAVYLEVIKSQQRLYRFEHGKLVKTYIVSTGLTWETPPGTYTILDKSKMSMSYHDNWYMPDYLPIGYINGQYRFGFHAIPYHMDGAGNIYSRDINTMGSPATGGCIQLTPVDAEELFNWAWVGIPVYVYE